MHVLSLTLEPIVFSDCVIWIRIKAALSQWKGLGSEWTLYHLESSKNFHCSTHIQDKERQPSETERNKT